VIEACGRRSGADLIVMAAHNFDPIECFLLSSVTAAVLEHSPCPIAGGETATVDQTLPDGHRIAATGQTEFDSFLVGPARTRRRTPAGLRTGHGGCDGRRLRAKVGDHRGRRADRSRNGPKLDERDIYLLPARHI
jgi:hypothetical protein